MQAMAMFTEMTVNGEPRGNGLNMMCK